MKKYTHIKIYHSDLEPLKQQAAALGISLIEYVHRMASEEHTVNQDTVNQYSTPTKKTPVNQDTVNQPCTDKSAPAGEKYPPHINSGYVSARNGGYRGSIEAYAKARGL